jgi:hypothetical protein
MPTPFARQAEQAMIRLTFGYQGDTVSREYRRTHSQKKNTRRMLQDSLS